MSAAYPKRLAGVRRHLKARLYATVGALLRGQPGADEQGRLLDLLTRLSDLEAQDGPGALVRLLTGLPAPAAEEIRQALQRLLAEREHRRGRSTREQGE
jgi:hypothetical protein